MKTKLNSFKINLSLSCLLMVTLIWFGGSVNAYAQQFPSNCLPPANSSYTAHFHQTYNGVNVYDLSDPIHSKFTGCDPPPPGIGDSTIHSFGSLVTATLRINNGPPMMITAPAQVTVKVKKVAQNGNTGIFQTEMLQLNISGGNLPPGTRIRESPTLQSTGQTAITAVGTGFNISSFFDVFTELSTNGGGTWTPSSGSGHIVLSSTIPTLSQWGLIILVLLILTIGLVMIRKKQLAVAGVESAAAMSYFPFDKRIYIRMLVIMLVLGSVGLIFARLYYGTLSSPDILGTLVSSFIAAYIAYLFFEHKEKN